MTSLPVLRDDKSAPFFDAAAEQRLMVRRCLDCQQMLPPEAVVCATCGGTELIWVEAVGTGSLVTWTTVHRAPNRAYADVVPYVVGVIELDEGPWLYGRVTSQPSNGMRVRAVYPDVTDGDRFPVFEEEPS